MPNAKIAKIFALMNAKAVAIPRNVFRSQRTAQVIVEIALM